MLLKEDDDLILAVYDYWLNKRLELQQCLIPVVKSEPNREQTGCEQSHVGTITAVEKVAAEKAVAEKAPAVNSAAAVVVQEASQAL